MWHHIWYKNMILFVPYKKLMPSCEPCPNSAPLRSRDVILHSALSFCQFSLGSRVLIDVEARLEMRPRPVRSRLLEEQIPGLHPRYWFVTKENHNHRLWDGRCRVNWINKIKYLGILNKQFLVNCFGCCFFEYQMVYCFQR